MPNRIIRDACRTSPSLSALSDLAERTFWRVITVLDDHGRYHGELPALMSACFPVGARGLTTRRFAEAVSELSAGDLLRFYEIGSRKYVYSPTWSKYQQVRSLRSKHPEPQASANICKQIPADSFGDVVVVGDVVGDVTTPPSPPPGGRALRAQGTVPEGFDRFWSAYPPTRRRGRQEAITAWRSLRLTPSQVQQVMASLESWKASRDWRKEAGKWIPWPQKFLRKRRWEETVDPERSVLADILGDQA
jgi:hypothetical protein